ncbi:MAG: GTP cyclohydrolase I FolE [Calditrichia bacterium]
MDIAKIEEGVRLILEGLGEDLSREGIRQTPERVAGMFAEILGQTGKLLEVEAGISEEIADDLIIVKNIPFYSMCEHHLLPFFGTVHLAYVPNNNRVAGFSSLTRLVDNASQRLQLQERLTHQIADSLMSGLQAQGVLVVVEAQQLCVSMRGTRKDRVRTVTQAIRGEISLDRLRMSGFLLKE